LTLRHRAATKIGYARPWQEALRFCNNFFALLELPNRPILQRIVHNNDEKEPGYIALGFFTIGAYLDDIWDIYNDFAASLTSIPQSRVLVVKEVSDVVAFRR
jgi:hypothetical protein